MQELVDLIENIGDTSLGFAFCRFILAAEDRLQQFEVPVAELVPDEAIETASGLVEPEAFERFGDIADRP
ncbi:hypothetical protein D3C86_2242230 [compost metagenome]